MTNYSVHVIYWEVDFIPLLLFSHKVVSDLATPWTAACQDSLSFTISRSVFKFTSIESMVLSNHFILCCPLLLLPSIFPSIRISSNELALCIRWRKYWSFSFSISPSDEYSWLISFRIDWFDHLTVQGTFKSLLQHHNSKASILWLSHRLIDSAFLWSNSHPFMTTRKTIALIIYTFVNKVMCLLFKMLSRFVITFIPKSKHLVISWLQSPSTVI